MTDDTKQTRGKHLAVFATLFGVAALAWMFYLADVLVVDHLKSKWVEWYGVEWYKASEWHWLPVLGLVTFGPMFFLGAIAIWLASRFYYLNLSSIHEANLKELGKAKTALQQSLVSVEVIEREYKGKLQSFERLQTQLDELQSVKDIDTQELRKKLNAIALASRHTIWFQRFLGFAIGVMSSLLAAYIWERLH